MSCSSDTILKIAANVYKTYELNNINIASTEFQVNKKRLKEFKPISM